MVRSAGNKNEQRADVSLLVDQGLSEIKMSDAMAWG